MHRERTLGEDDDPRRSDSFKACDVILTGGDGVRARTCRGAVSMNLLVSKYGTRKSREGQRCICSLTLNSWKRNRPEATIYISSSSSTRRVVF